MHHKISCLARVCVVGSLREHCINHLVINFHNTSPIKGTDSLKTDLQTNLLCCRVITSQSLVFPQRNQWGENQKGKIGHLHITLEMCTRKTPWYEEITPKEALCCLHITWTQHKAQKEVTASVVNDTAADLMWSEACGSYLYLCLCSLH